MAYHDNLWVHNSLAQGMATKYHKRCSIPQDCPLSMLILALLTRPQIIKMKQAPCFHPRVLADDMLPAAIGNSYAAFL